MSANLTDQGESVSVGQIWADKDQLRPRRRLRVVSVHPRSLCAPAYARLRNTDTGRESGIQLARLLRNYRLASDEEAAA